MRIGLHTGEGTLGGDNYVGLDVVRAARIADAAHGGQILLSDSTAALVAKDLPAGLRLRNLGSHELKSLANPEVISEVLIEGLEQEVPPLRTQSPRRGIPILPSSFIGREALVRQALELLDSSRLLTMVGPGGTGKTRLAIRVAEEAAPGLADGSYFVPLSTASDQGVFPSAILHALGVRAPDTVSPMDFLLEHVRDASHLLVVDNLEQILDVGKDVSALLEAAAGVKVLATSRAPLGVAGEQELPVPPMEVPHELGEVDDLLEVESIQLFMDRAAAKLPGFELTATNAPAVVELTR